jgi:hypothetical protein
MIMSLKTDTTKGMKPNAFSMTIDTRFYPDGMYELFYEIIAAIEEKNASLVSFLSREVFERLTFLVLY